MPLPKESDRKSLEGVINKAEKALERVTGENVIQRWQNVKEGAERKIAYLDDHTRDKKKENEE